MNEPGDQQFGATPPPPPPPLGPQDAPPGAGNPWEQRDRLGFGAALLENIKLFVTRPSEAYERTRKRGDFVSPLLFGVIVGWFGALLGQIWQFLFQGSMLSALPPEMRDQMSLYMVSSPAVLVINMVLTPVYLLVALFIGSAIHHVCLLLVGALRDSESGFEGTFRINGYAYVGQVAAIVPFIGWLISIVWFVALQVIGAQKLHGTTSGKALAGALIPWALCCVCFTLLFGLLGAAIMGSFR